MKTATWTLLLGLGLILGCGKKDAAVTPADQPSAMPEKDPSGKAVIPEKPKASVSP